MSNKLSNIDLLFDEVKSDVLKALKLHKAIVVKNVPKIEPNELLEALEPFNELLHSDNAQEINLLELNKALEPIKDLLLKNKDQENVDICKLYEADKTLNDLLVYNKYKLEKELEDDSEIKKYNFDKIVRFFNPNDIASSYYTFTEKKWKEVNDPIKVKARLDEEFAVWSNAYRKHAFKELELNKKGGAFLEENKREIEAKISEALVKKDWILENFENLSDVRISSINRAKYYGTINYALASGGKKKKKHISVIVPNVIYCDKEIARKNNKLSGFLDTAINPFGDVWYLM